MDTNTPDDVEREEPPEAETAPEAEASPAAEAPPEAEAPAEDASDQAEAGEPAGAEADEAEAAETTPDEPAAAAPAAARSDEGKKTDVVPGANLEPIAIGDERELTAEEQARLEAEQEERAEREAAPSDDEEDELPAREAAEVPADTSIQATGKRKSSIARVLLRAGDGSIAVNGRSLEDFFPRPYHQSLARQPLVTAGYDGNLAIQINVQGGGISGQAGAIRHGIARALCELDPELRGDLKKRGMLTRDAREKERRKAGLKKARKRPQFSKR